MSLLNELSEFIGTNIADKEITFKGKVRTFRFLELTADDAESFFLSVDADPKKNKGLRNRIIAKIVVDADGNPAFTEKDAGTLPNELANTLQAMALELNGVGKKEDGEVKKD